MIDEPSGARTIAVALPEARRLRRAIDSLDLPVPRSRPGTVHPLGERGEAAQLVGTLRGYVQQIETGLSGGPLHTDVQKGYFTAYDRNMAALIANESDRVMTLSEFARQGIMELPHASQQMSVAAAALRTAAIAFAAASEIAVGLDSPDFDPKEAVRQSEMMYAAFDVLAGYVAAKREEFGD